MLKEFVNCFTRLLDFLAVVVLLLIVLVSISRPLLSYDTWYYHLSFSSYLLDIGNGKDAFIMAPSVNYRLMGFPLFSELIQGILWKYSGYINSITLINSVTLLSFILCLNRFLKINLFLLVAGLLSMPVIGIHAISSYNDLFSGLLIASQFILSAYLYKNNITNRKQNNNFNYKIALMIYCIVTIFAGNTKFMSWAISIFISLSLILVILFKTKLKRIRLVVVIFFIMILASSTIIKNIIKYDNPFYPINYKIPLINTKLKGHEKQFESYPGYANSLGVLKRPVYFFLSITEIDWFIRDVKSKYNIDSNTGDNPGKYQRARTGGLWGIYILVNILIFTYCIVTIKRKSLNTASYEKYLISMFLALSLVTSFMPQSHQVRYYLYWPILLVFFNLYMLTLILHKNVMYWAVGIFYISSMICSHTLLNVKGYKLNPYPLRIYNKSYFRSHLNKDILSILDKNKNICLNSKFNPHQFKYSQAVIGGNHKIEQLHHSWEKCRVFKEYPDY